MSQNVSLNYSKSFLKWSFWVKSEEISGQTRRVGACTKAVQSIGQRTEICCTGVDGSEKNSPHSHSQEHVENPADLVWDSLM